jgi:peroxiredoxin
MANKNYSFELLFDSDNSVASQFSVEGIPSKFVIDEQGNIRFKSIGYSGSEAGVITEITTMIQTLIEKKGE